MLYLKGGWGWANDRFSIHSTTASFSTPPYTTYGYADITDTRWGPMVGAGIEHALDAHWSAKIEYDYLDLGTKNYTFNGTVIAPSLLSPRRRQRRRFQRMSASTSI